MREEAKRLLDEEVLGYTVATGVPGLREAVAAHHRRTSGIDVSLDDVVITTGSSGGFLLAFLAAFEPGDRVVMARPGYACYRNVLTALGLRGRRDRLRSRDPLPADGRAARRGRGAGRTGLVIASPANPTGTMVPPDELAAIARWCEDNGVRLVSDEIYHGITYGGARAVAAPGRPRAPGWCSGRSRKYFSMTGWRLGWMLVPEDLRRPVDVLTGNFTICPPVLSQYAAIAAFTPGVLRRARRPRRPLRRPTARCCSRACPGWASTGSPRPTARSTCTPTSATSPTTPTPGACACSTRPAWPPRPGIDFDTRRGNEFVRLSFAGSAEEITEGLDRLGRWLA